MAVPVVRDLRSDLGQEVGAMLILWLVSECGDLQFDQLPKRVSISGRMANNLLQAVSSAEQETI